MESCVASSSLLTLMLTSPSANPNQKAADLISFDAFADDADETPLSGNGGLSLPPDSLSAAPSSSTSAMTSSGLPLDLFSAPSPSSSPGIPAYSSSSATPKQDPMAFFGQNPPPQAQPPAFNSTFGGSIPSPRTGLPGSQQRQAIYPMGFQSMTPTGFSLSPQPAQSNGAGTGQQSQQQRQQQQQQQGQKKDAFSDLVDLMS